MESIAHIREMDKRVQTVEEHLLEVRALAEVYGEKLGAKHLAGLAGMLHDLGKYTQEFSEYIKAAVSGSPNVPKRGSVDHSTAGGKLLYDLFHLRTNNPYKRIMAEIVGNAIISHHSYLKDFINPHLESPFLKRVRDTALNEFEQSKQAFFEYVISEQEFYEYVDKAAAELEQMLTDDSNIGFEVRCMFLTKFVFSALIDADRTNTRIFEANRAADPDVAVGNLFHIYYTRLMAKMDSFQAEANADSPIHVLRRDMSEQCDRFAFKPSGVYTLSIPTGGGKTLASLRYALKHAHLFNKKRIVYILPYTTIIEQNAEEVRRILKDEANILEHHSNVVMEDSEENDEEQDGMAMTTRQKLTLAKDNWDAPIVFTTMVQFLNVFYAKGSRFIRRLHRLCDAVIIFDEVQKIPTSCISLFNQALNFLKVYGQSSIVLCTATQPALDFVEQKLDINPDAEMIDDIDQVIDAFKRVEIIDRATEETFNHVKLTEFIQDQLDEVRSVLVILNTKAVVKSLYRQLKELAENQGAAIYHLSTLMCASHRKDILNQVKAHLIRKEKVICVSTPLIEAGVDVSFECVIRSMAGLDSIAQAAGRCNRHGEDAIRQVYVINHVEENLQHLKEIRVGKQSTRKILTDLKRNPADHGGHLLSRPAMKRYFQEYYSELRSNLNYSIASLRKDMTELLFASKSSADTYFQAYRYERKEQLPLFIANSYGTAAEHFHVIEDHTTAVIVPYGGGKDVIADLNGAGTIDDLTRLIRKAQQFTVNLYEHELRQLDLSGGMESCLDGKVLVLKEGAYSEDFGCDIENDSAQGWLGI